MQYYTGETMDGRQELDNRLAAMTRNVLRMGVLVEEALRKTLTALETEDFALAAEVVRDDRRIDDMQATIEDQCATIIAEEHPDGETLRRILTAIKVASELERIGDHARHLSRRARSITDAAFFEVLPLIQQMAERGVAMVHDGLTAFIEDDEDAACGVAARDDEIDRLHAVIYRKLLATMHENPALLEKGTELILVNRFLERLGDHVTNMCESIVFSRRAEHVELNK